MRATDGTDTYVYTYDGAGNILTSNKKGTAHTYTYGDSNWRDLLTAYDGQTISYDGAGNPTSYYNGTRWTFTWGNGRRLETASGNGNTVSYAYDANGLRTSKTVNGVVHTYYYSGGLLRRETYGDTVLDFFYDANGTPYSMLQNRGAMYYYITNLQGDVIRLVNSSGQTAAYYEYDPYGNAIKAAGSHCEINPLRYRGYVYDTETGLYYCQSRYYDPEIGRFISADTYTSTGQGIIGNNMFAYCGNNFVNRKDIDGKAFETVFDVISLGYSIADVIKNPSDPFAWAGLVGDLVDVAVPFVTGIGEATKAVSFAAKSADALDDAYDTAKAVEAIGGLCFVAGTPVHTEDGYKEIENVAENDFVWAWDEETGDVALKRVVETYVNETEELVHIFVNGEEIITTPAHPFYSPVKGWTDACKLRAGDILVLVNGEYVVVEKVQYEILETPVAVYNFQVEDYHTYYVSDAGVLVHNKCIRNTIVSSREEALEYGRKFLGEGYKKEGPGRYVSADRFRQMRFDFTHHDGTTHHINLETFKYRIEKGKRNKLVTDEHVFW